MVGVEEGVKDDHMAKGHSFHLCINFVIILMRCLNSKLVILQGMA